MKSRWNVIISLSFYRCYAFRKEKLKRRLEQETNVKRKQKEKEEHKQKYLNGMAPKKEEEEEASELIEDTRTVVKKEETAEISRNSDFSLPRKRQKERKRTGKGTAGKRSKVKPGMLKKMKRALDSGGTPVMKKKKKLH